MFPRWSLTTGLAPWVERSRSLQVVHTFDAAQAFRHAVERDVRGAFKRGDRTDLGAAGRTTPAVVSAAKCSLARVEGTHASGRAGLGTDGGDGPAPRYPRIRTELDWQPVYGAPTTVRELLEGMHQANGQVAKPALAEVA